ncbi:MAG: hypothetical protein KI793_33435 [Rivularia sp. (in: Bacteria)]|nr:hypothetical protein [Rivularia sp. MS3]
MSTFKKLMNSVKILAICAVLVVGLFAPVAMADESLGFRRLILETGKENYEKSQTIYSPVDFNSVVVSLNPANQTGTIDKIRITGPDGKREFECKNREIENGDDLVKLCGAEGPLHLVKGDTKYEASVSGFKPNTQLQVNFK